MRRTPIQHFPPPPHLATSTFGLIYKRHASGNLGSVRNHIRETFASSAKRRFSDTLIPIAALWRPPSSGVWRAPSLKNARWLLDNWTTLSDSQQSGFELDLKINIKLKYLLILSLFVAKSCVVRLSCLADEIIWQTGSILGGIASKNRKLTGSVTNGIYSPVSTLVLG